MKKQKNSSCCLFSFFRILFTFAFLLLVIGFIGVGSVNKDTSGSSVTAKATATTKVTAKPTVAPTEKATEHPTVEPTEKPLEIILRYPELGEYGRFYTMNEKVEKAEESDKETIIQCFVPAGTYIVTYEGRGPWSYVYMYTEKHVITEYGWEEPADAWVSQQLRPGDSCEVTVPEGWYIHLNENDVFSLVQK